MKRFLLLFALALLPALAAFGQTPEEDPDVLYATELLAPGTVAPEIELPDADGKTFSLSSLRGAPVVLVFWASWCPDCRAEVPELKAMYELYAPAGVRFVSVSFDRSIEKWKEYIAAESLPGVQLFDPAGKKESTVGAAFGVKWIPSLYLIGPDGKILVRTVVAGRIAKALSSL